MGREPRGCSELGENWSEIAKVSLCSARQAEEQACSTDSV